MAYAKLCISRIMLSYYGILLIFNQLRSMILSIIRPLLQLDLSFQAERLPPSYHIQHELLMAAEESDEYF